MVIRVWMQSPAQEAALSLCGCYKPGVRIGDTAEMVSPHPSLVEAVQAYRDGNHNQLKGFAKPFGSIDEQQHAVNHIHHAFNFRTDPSSTAHPAIHDLTLRMAIAHAIDDLPEKERLMISLYYYEELTMKEIGEVLGITESRVSQIHSKAVFRLRTRLKALIAEEL